MTIDETRSRTMRAVRSKDTKPELIVRRLIHSLGFRFRLHRRDLPGSPDLVFSGRRKVIFVHGCFWHGHDCVRGNRKPVANADYWHAKIRGNVERDIRNETALRENRWDVLTIWECETKLKDREAITRRVMSFLSEEL